MDPVVAQKAPCNVSEDPDARWWCACGRSAGQPYCDGSHRGTGITPVRVEMSRTNTTGAGGGKTTSQQAWGDERRPRV